MRTQLRTAGALIAVVFALAAAGTMVPVRAHADVDADVRLSMYPDADAVGVGAGFLMPFGSTYNWFFNPNAEMAFGDEDFFSVNGDVHYDFASQSSTSFWLGAGPAIVSKEKGDDRDTGLGLNLLFGVGMTRGAMRPYAQLKGMVGEHDGIALAGGLRF